MAAPFPPPPWDTLNRDPSALPTVHDLPLAQVRFPFPQRAHARVLARTAREARKESPLLFSLAAFAVADLCALFSLVVLAQICFVVDLLPVVPSQFRFPVYAIPSSMCLDFVHRVFVALVMYSRCDYLPVAGPVIFASLSVYSFLSLRLRLACRRFIFVFQLWHFPSLREAYTVRRGACHALGREQR